MQVMLINSVKDVASALGDLIHATKSASGKNISDPAMIYLKDSAKVSTKNNYFFFTFLSSPFELHQRRPSKNLFSFFFMLLLLLLLL